MNAGVLSPMEITEGSLKRRFVHRRQRGVRVRIIAFSLAVAACGGGGSTRPAPAASPAPEAATRNTLGPQYDAIGLFRRLGLLARGAPMPFVGSVSFFATPTADSTHVLVAISISNSALTFAREGDRFRAGYTIAITLKSSGTDAVKPIEAHEAVVVSSFKETTRADESVLFEEIITIPPGRYDFAVSVRDDGSARTSEDAVALAVPSVHAAALSTPVSYARVGIRGRLTALPQIVANPTAGATFGRDTVIPFFLESYGPQADSTRTVAFAVRSENGRSIYRDSAALAWRGQLYAGTVSIPISKVGIGAMSLGVWVPGRADTVRAPLFVGFGGDLPLASYEEMLNYLRWFAPAYRLQALRDTAPEFRPAAWSAFVRDYSGSEGNASAFADYFARMLEANTRFREEASPGWQTDRGKVLLGLGRPDQVYEQIQRSMSQQGRVQNWEYRAYNLALTFYDQNGFGRWKLTTASESEFVAAWRRRVQ
jgi:GWxTD domain-containing protein